MRFEKPLLEGIFLKRYKRFFADLVVDGKAVVAHVPNSGSMKGCNTADSPCRLTHNPDPSRKLAYTLEMIKTPSSWVGVNTSHPNKMVFDLWQSQALPHWTSYDRAQREVKIHEESRIDLALWNERDFPETLRLTPEQVQTAIKKKKPKLHFVEVKNVSLAENGVALFPDSVTERGQKHLVDLMELVKKGHGAEIVFVIQREDCQSFAPADLIDKEYGSLLRKALQSGVLVTPLACRFSPSSIEIIPKPLPLSFS
jgi:sugar fermentation stimulation protein A